MPKPDDCCPGEPCMGDPRGMHTFDCPVYLANVEAWEADRRCRDAPKPDPLADGTEPNAARVLQRIIRSQTGVIVKEHICRRIINAVVEPARAQGIAEGRRQATEGWERESLTIAQETLAAQAQALDAPVEQPEDGAR